MVATNDNLILKLPFSYMVKNVRRLIRTKNNINNRNNNDNDNDDDDDDNNNNNNNNNNNKTWEEN